MWYYVMLHNQNPSRSSNWRIILEILRIYGFFRQNLKFIRGFPLQNSCKMVVFYRQSLKWHQLFFRWILEFVLMFCYQNSSWSGTLVSYQIIAFYNVNIFYHCAVRRAFFWGYKFILRWYNESIWAQEVALLCMRRRQFYSYYKKQVNYYTKSISRLPN